MSRRLLPLPFLLLAACAGPRAAAEGDPAAAAPAASAPAVDSVVLERSPCFGFCPTYRVRIDGAGRVAYESRHSPDSTRGTAEAAPAVLDTLARRADALGFFTLPARLRTDRAFCPNAATDHASVTVGVFAAGRAHQVEDYLGCRVESDSAGARVAALRALEAAIDSAAGVSRWVRPGTR